MVQVALEKRNVTFRNMYVESYRFAKILTQEKYSHFFKILPFAKNKRVVPFLKTIFAAIRQHFIKKSTCSTLVLFKPFASY